MRCVYNLLVAWALTVTGCSLLVDSTKEQPLRCLRSDGGPEVCPEGLECRSGYCEPACISSSAEICGDNIDNDCDGVADEPDPSMPDTCGDGIDNNCDGQIDEGSDNDGDGYAWCGDTRTAAGRRMIDCDDYKASVHPEADEMCDGADNDCDGVTDPASSTRCPPGQECIDQRCVMPSCAIERSGVVCGTGERCEPVLERCVAAAACPATCGAEEYCDAASKTCKKREPSPNGSPCGADAECKSGACVDAAALRLTSGPRVCAQACCDDRQCDASERCFSSGTGARSCLPKSLVPATVLTQCTSDGPCMAPSICALNKNQTLQSSAQFEPRSSLTTSTCRDDGLNDKGPGTGCFTYLDCDSRACAPRAGFGGVCSTPCGSSAECAGFAAAAGGPFEEVHAYCRYMSVSLDLSQDPPDYASVCAIDSGSETGPGAYGAECASAAECQDRGCVGATGAKKGRCTPVCCNDSQCPADPYGKHKACRPFAFGTTYEMRCAL